MLRMTRALAAMLVTLTLFAGCTGSTGDRRMSSAPAEASPVLTPLPGHPPITASGVVANYTAEAGLLTFQDGRVVRLTNVSTISGRGDPRALRTGEQVVVDKVLPVGVMLGPSLPTAPDPAQMSVHRERQRMATVVEVNEASRLVRLSDGTLVRVTPATKMHLGATGRTVVLTDMQPGDELFIVLVDGGTMEGESPSALPRQSTTPRPTDAQEIMIFRVVR